MEWLSSFVIPSIWDVIPVMAFLGGGAVIGAVKKFRDAWGAPLLYGVAGGGVIFICLWLPVQLNQHFGEDKRIGDEQTAALERIANEQRKTLARLTAKQTAASGEIAREQKEILVILAKGIPTRPYFTPTTAKIYKISEGKIYLTVSVQNNEVPAENVVSHLLVINEALDQRKAPLHSNRMESANAIGPGGTHGHHWGPVTVPKSARPAYVVFQMRYTHALSDEEYRQVLFLRFQGASETGNFIMTLFNAISDEKKRIEKYMSRRGIAKL